jgi:hypothetical protein
MTSNPTRGRSPILILALAAIITIGTAGLWQATGRDYYTKFEVVEEVVVAVDPDDPLAAAGFYDDAPRKQTVRRSEFRFGLLPTTTNPLDKHMLAVLSVLGPTWLLALSVMWWQRRRSAAVNPIR